MIQADKYVISEEQLSELIGFQLFAKPALARAIRSTLLSTEVKKEYDRGYNDGASTVVADLNILEHIAAKKERERILSKENLVELQEIADKMHVMGVIKNNTLDAGLSELISFWLRDDL